jgi:hypothetical protein
MVERREQPQARSEAAAEKEEARYAPHLVFLKQLERLDEKMADDPKGVYPAFVAWRTGLMSWAREDPQYWREYEKTRRLQALIFAQHGYLNSVEYAGIWRPVFIGVMRRAGMFPRMGEEAPPKDNADLVAGE